MSVRSYGIGTLSRETGVGVETIRYYERIGLFAAPERTAAGYRRYAPEHAQRLRFIRSCRDLGLGTQSIRSLLRLTDDPARSCDDVDGLVAVQLQEVERRIADLSRLRDRLRELASCRGRTISECRVINALSECRAIDALTPDPPSR